MPEGDTIFRTAQRLRPLLENQRVLRCSSREAALDATSLVGHTVSNVESRGKHLLVHFEDHRCIHSHLGMTGSWHVYASGQPWRKPVSRAALSLETARSVCVCFSPKTLELLTADGLRRHRFLSQLGPDLLAARFDATEVLPRFRVHNAAPIGDVFMNQSIVCGVGNVYKSETLFLCRVNPFVPVGELADDALVRLVRTARRLLKSNLGGYPRRTRHALDGQRLWVYQRSNAPCYQCGQTIRVRRQGDLGRTTFWCPECQK
jgi:endonuclease-8